jgi:peptide/nickel transport system permease protein
LRCPARWGRASATLLSLTLVFVPQVARIAESVTAQVRHMDYIDAARATGASALTIIRVQVLGNVLGPIFVFSTGLISVCMILASGLSFLGLGVRPPEPEWGLMLNTLRTAIYTQPWVAALPPDDFYHLHFVQYPRGPPACGNGD